MFRIIILKEQKFSQSNPVLIRNFQKNCCPIQSWSGQNRLQSWSNPDPCSSPVAYLGYDRHDTCHGRHFDGSAKIAGQELKCYLQFLEPLFCAPYIHKLQSCINTAPSPNALTRVCCASTTKHHDKTVVLWHNMRVRHSDRTEHSQAMSTRPHPSHAIRKDKSVCAAAFQARRY